MREVRLRAEDGSVDITIPMGDGVAVPTGGYGGYKTVDRQDGIAVTDWTGQAPITEDVPLMLDGGRQKRSIERELTQVRRLGRDPDGGPPPIFKVWGPIHHGEGKRWVLPDNGIEFSTDEEECKLRNDSEHYRQAFTLHLLEYVDPDTIHIRGKQRGRARRLSDNVAVGGTYTTKEGDTLQSIAAHELNNWRRAKELGRVNGRTDPHERLPAGLTLRFP